LVSDSTTREDFLWKKAFYVVLRDQHTCRYLLLNLSRHGQYQVGSSKKLTLHLRAMSAAKAYQCGENHSKYYAGA
jgi:hypothetical protein